MTIELRLDRAQLMLLLALAITCILVRGVVAHADVPQPIPPLPTAPVASPIPVPEPSDVVIGWTR